MKLLVCLMGVIKFSLSIELYKPLIIRHLSAYSTTTTADSVDLSAYDGLSLSAATAWDLGSNNSGAIWEALGMTEPTSLVATYNGTALVSGTTPVTVGVNDWSVVCNQTDGNWEKGGTIELTSTFNDNFSHNGYGWVGGNSPANIKITITVDPSIALTTWADMRYNNGNALTAAQGATVGEAFDWNTNNETSDEAVLTTFFGLFGAAPARTYTAYSATGEERYIPVTWTLRHTPVDANTQESYTLVVKLDEEGTIPNGYTVSENIGEGTQVFLVEPAAANLLSVLEMDAEEVYDTEEETGEESETTDELVKEEESETTDEVVSDDVTEAIEG